MVVMPLAASLPFYFIHVYLRETSMNIWALTGISLAAQAAVWTAVIAAFYREYVSGAQMRLLVQTIRGMIPGVRPPPSM